MTSEKKPSLFSRLIVSLFAGLIGAAAGYFYAHSVLPTELLDAGKFPALYGTAGAACSILVVRFTAIVRSFLRDS